PEGVSFINGDLRNESDIQKVFKEYRIDAVMHFAASSLVPESMSNPLKYYDNNVLACINLLKAMLENKVTKFIFSSTAAVYGEPENIPIKEEDKTRPTNTYGRSKLMIENILRDISHAHDFSYIALRYFNAAGAHPSGKIGEKHNPETHLIPNILKAAKGEKSELMIFGNDYPTPDGTCIRDFIHVQDLCHAHLLALKALKDGMKSDIFNLGSGSGYSVKEVVQTVEEVTGKKINAKIGPRRAGDPAKLVASAEKAQMVLGWKPKANLDEIIRSAWAWESKN
ncbi:MAG TPA: UDP-glucose 4-epimerase GalE, partial [Candidatus Wunengus sp. YC60]|uniref:UDP-glucose 4-epimerase GalE n=1 Tax=Candidatus Wunengus sp. YC60 TaxID=3367697 RepID=UPI004029FC8B